MALEKELDLLEARPTVTDPAIQQVIQRFQSNVERWRQRGYEAGREWAIQRSTRQEFEDAARRNSAGSQGIDLTTLSYSIFPWPASFDAEEETQTHLLLDLGFDHELPAASDQVRLAAQVFRDEHSSEFLQARAQVDEDAFIQGWKRATSEVWEAVAPALGYPDQ